jgi:hypothetical protein
MTGAKVNFINLVNDIYITDNKMKNILTTDENVLITDNSQRHLQHKLETIKLEFDFDVNNSNQTKSKGKIYIPPLKGLNNNSNEFGNNAIKSNRESKRVPNSRTERSDFDTIRNNNSLREDIAYKDYYNIVNILKDSHSQDNDSNNI